jgi:hypothetical protein
MYLIQLFLPLRDNAGVPFPPTMFAAVRAGLADAFGGVTAYQRAPATGLWEDGSNGIQRDDLMLFEVMATTLDRTWWKNYAAALAERFRQESVLVRAMPCEWL